MRFYYLCNSRYGQLRPDNTNTPSCYPKLAIHCGVRICRRTSGRGVSISNPPNPAHSSFHGEWAKNDSLLASKRPLVTGSGASERKQTLALLASWRNQSLDECE